MNRYAHFLFLVVFFSLSKSILAAGPTGEDSSLEELNTGRIPLQVSQDGKWLVHLNGDSILHRTNIKDENIDQKIMLFQVPLAISASQDAQRVAVFDGGCIRVVNFSEQPARSHKIKSTCSAGSGSFTAIQDPGDAYSGAATIALSKDAKKLAYPLSVGSYQSESIRVIDIDTEELRATIPVSGTVLHVRFLDGDNKLLVVQAIMGQAWEGDDSPSDMQFAVWDLKKRELFSFFHSNTLSNLDTDDFLWSFSEASGELMTIKSEAELRQNREKSSPVSISRFNLKQCRSEPSISFVVKGDPMRGDQFLEMTSDPAGRWLATIEANNLIVRSLGTGEVIYEENLEKTVRSLSSTIDGGAVVGVDAGKLTHVDGESSYQGGGKLIQVALADKLAALPEPKVQNWSGEACKIENEVANARRIKTVQKTAKKLYEINLGFASNASVLPFLPYECYADPENSNLYDGHGHAKSWGLAEDSGLWVDRYNTIEELAPLTAKHIRDMPTLRSEAVCRIPLFNTKQFLSWGSDEVTLTPFFSELNNSNARVFVKRENFVAKLAVQRKNNITVAWGKNEENKENLNYSFYTIYDLLSGRELLDQPEVNTDYSEPAFEVWNSSELKAGEYHWSSSYMNSIRAEYRVPESNELVTSFWDGLGIVKQQTVETSQDTRYVPTKLVDLGAGKAVLLQRDRVVFYDAVTKSRFSEIKLAAPIDAQWSEKNHLLFVETAPLYVDHGYEWKLHAYKID